MSDRHVNPPYRVDVFRPWAKVAFRSWPFLIIPQIIIKINKLNKLTFGGRVEMEVYEWM